MTYEEKRKVDKLRLQGYGCTAISNTLGISLNSVKSYCRRSKPKEIPIDVINEGGCEFCGKSLVHIEGKKKKKFCCDKCRISWWNHNRDKIHHRVSYEIVCLYCGETFVSTDNSRKYCSQNCYRKSRCNYE